MRLKEDSNGYYLSLFLRENDLTPTSFFQKRGNKKIKIKNGKNKLTCQVLVGVSKSLFGKIEYTITDDTNDLSDKNSLSILISCLVEKNLNLSSQVISNEGQFVFPESCRILDSGNWSLFLGNRDLKVFGFVAIVPLTLWYQTNNISQPSYHPGNLSFYYLTKDSLFGFILDSYGNSFKNNISYSIRGKYLKGKSYEEISFILSDSETLNAYLEVSQAKNDLAKERLLVQASAKQQATVKKRFKGTKQL